MVRQTVSLSTAWAEANAGAQLGGAAVTVSGDREPGEGEQKIMAIAETKKEIKKQKNTVVFANILCIPSYGYYICLF